MSDEELRIAVAERLGWHHCFVSEGRCYGTPEWEKRELPQAACLTIPEPKPFFHPIPNYPTSLDACLPLIERMKAEGYHYIIGSAIEQGHCASFSKPDVLASWQFADHPARALCMAFLKARKN